MANGTINYLKEYLISLGWKIDTNSLKFATDKTNTFINSVKSKVGDMGTAYIDAGIAGVHAIAKITESTFKLLNTTAEADKQTEKLAKRYFTTEKNARAFFGSLESMNIDYSDLFWTTDEERRQFQELYSFSKSLEVPDEVENTLKTVREFGLEFKKLQALIQYGSRAIAYYIGQYAGDEIDYWLKQLKTFIKLGREYLPKIAEKIGRAASVVLTFISAIGKGLQKIYSFLKPVINFMKGMPNEIKIVSAAITFFLLSPLGKVISALSIIMLLVEDFMYWKAGKHSAIDWSGFVSVFSGISDAVKDVKEDLDKVKDYFYSGDYKNTWIYKLFSYLSEKIKTIGEFLGIIDEEEVDAKRGRKEKDGKHERDHDGRIIRKISETELENLKNSMFSDIAQDIISAKWLNKTSNENAIRSFGIKPITNNREVTNNFVSNDTYNLSSPQDVMSTLQRNINNIKKQANNYFSEAFR